MSKFPHGSASQGHLVLPTREHLNEEDEELARLFSPILLLDKREPFRPQVIGVTVARSPTLSSSFSGNLMLVPPNDGVIIEYALWWDWDINHLYELEHVWVTGSNSNDKPVVWAVEGSSHGGSRKLDAARRDTHPVVYCEPGKHAFFVPESAPSLEPRTLTLLCQDWAGCGGLIGRAVAPGSVPLRFDPANRRVTRRWLQQHAFTPSFEFTTEVVMETLPLRPWLSVAAWIPSRIKTLLEVAQHASAPPPLRAIEKSSLEDLALRYRAQYELVLVAEPPPVAVGNEADRLAWASVQLRTARRRGIRIILQMADSVPTPLVVKLRELISKSGLSQSSVLLLPARTALVPLQVDSDLALGYVLDDSELGTPALQTAVLAGVEYAFAPHGYTAIPEKTRSACSALGLSWILLSHDDAEITQREATAIVLDRGL